MLPRAQARGKQVIDTRSPGGAIESTTNALSRPSGALLQRRRRLPRAGALGYSQSSLRDYTRTTRAAQLGPLLRAGGSSATGRTAHSSHTAKNQSGASRLVRHDGAFGSQQMP